MPAEELEKTTDIDPDALMREYKQNGSLEVRNQLVMYYSYIARSMAVKMSSTYHKYATTEEMVNQCVIALINSLERFDPDKGVKFSTYAFTKVRGAIINYVRKQDWLSRRVRQMDIRILKTEDELSLELGRPPTRLEMADRLQITPEEFDRCVWEMSGENIYSLETLLTTPGRTQSSLTLEGVFDPEDEMDEQELRSQLMKAIDELNEQERTVLSLYYYEDLTMREIGQVLGVSEQRVGQINQKLIRKLREKLAYYTKG